jgi:hypothetical protein
MDIARSLPQARPGSAWQRGPGVGAWVRTLGGTLLHPRSSMRRVRIEARRSRSLCRVNAVVGAGLATVVPAGAYLVQMARDEAPYQADELPWPMGASALRVVALAGSAVGVWVGLSLVVLGLTAVEARGIRLYGRVHRSRVTPTVAAAVTGHATAGWVLGGALVGFGFVAGLVTYEAAMHGNVGVVRGAMLLGPILVPVLGGVVGLLAFETLTYLGVRRCRFANRARDVGPGRDPEGV